MLLFIYRNNIPNVDFNWVFQKSTKHMNKINFHPYVIKHINCGMVITGTLIAREVKKENCESSKSIWVQWELQCALVPHITRGKIHILVARQQIMHPPTPTFSANFIGKRFIMGIIRGKLNIKKGPNRERLMYWFEGTCEVSFAYGRHD